MSIFGSVPLGVVPPPPAGASDVRSSHTSLPRATVHLPDFGWFLSLIRFVRSLDLSGFVARGKPPAHPRKQRAAVPGLADVGIFGSAPLGVVPPPLAGASDVRSSQPRYHALRVHLPDFGWFLIAGYGMCDYSVSVVL
ncbi:hypothetical protein [Vreelandella neptunia]|uniref:Uncharacterized protein n=1 Tax=Vreelandella neptunia TaxID=115551 RepID=A0ABS9S1N4_9GAMM|nr:hypothetical protein [Halomonas neptunia]MCH4810029.1 hypothetical protein [Halomonas neptunia]